MKIYLVDDSKTSRILIRHHLRNNFGHHHQYIDYVTATDALNKVSEELPDLILSDWHMPDMNGIEFLTELKKKKEEGELKKEIPFVFVTSESTKDVAELALKEGAAAFITKPFTEEIFNNVLTPFLEG